MDYAVRRQKLLAQMEPQSLLLLAGNSEIERTNDVPYPFRQNSHMLYLTGYDQPNAYLMLGNNVERLYIKQLHPFMAVWEGRSNQLDQIRQQTGIAEIIEYKDGAEVQAAAEQTGLQNSTEAISLLIDHMRMVKEPGELELIRQAIAQTQAAIKHTRSLIKPGVTERQLAAEFVRFASALGYEQAFPPIISFGKNSCVIHHIPDDTKLKAGDIVLFDVGIEVQGYAADISRTFLPTKPTERQQQVYDAVRQVQAESIKLIKPGVRFDEFEQQAAQIMARALVDLGLFSSVEEANHPEGELEWPAYRRYFNHYISHFMGLDAHDVGPRDAVFAPGMVLTCEPGIYIAEEGIGVRIEDDVLITAAGYELLSAVPDGQ